MAIVREPLHSGAVSGSFGAIVFAQTLGKSRARVKVKPRNPQTQLQMDTRNDMTVASKCVKFANNTAFKAPTQTRTDKERINAIKQGNTLWNTTFTKAINGKQMMNYDDAVVAYTALTAPQKAAWDVAAAALVPAISAVAQVDAGGVAGTPITAGQVFFTYVYGLYKLGLSTVPGATPPVYA